MELPEDLHGLTSQMIAIETDNANRHREWAVVLGLKPTLDGDRWCILWGDDLQSGVAGFGTSPIEAMDDFDRAMYQDVRGRG